MRSKRTKFLKNWRNEGVLAAESQPAIYVYHQIFKYAGRDYTRQGFMARCRLERSSVRIHPKISPSDIHFNDSVVRLWTFCQRPRLSPNCSSS